MTRVRGSAPEELWLIASMVADEVDGLSSKEIEDEVRRRGEDPGRVAAAVREALEGSIRTVRRSRLSAAREKAARLGREMREGVESWMPSTATTRRQLLERVLIASPGLRSAMTVQFRDFSALSDEDVQSLLVQLRALDVEMDEGT